MTRPLHDLGEEHVGLIQNFLEIIRILWRRARRIWNHIDLAPVESVRTVLDPSFLYRESIAALGLRVGLASA